MRFPSCRHFLTVPALAAVALPLAFRAEATMPTPSGEIPRAVAEAFERGLFDLPARRAGLGVSTVPQTTWRVPIVLAAFADEDLTYAAAEFDSALFGTRQAIPTGSLREYYQWASGGRVDVTGRVVATVILPGSLAYYGDGVWGLSGRTPNSVQGAVHHALTLCPSDVDWSEFDVNRDGYVDMLWFVHAGKGGEASPADKRRLWSITSRFTADPVSRLPFETSQLVLGSQTQHYKIDRFSSLPEISGILPGVRSEIGVFCHEFGHALGLPDLYDTSVLGSVNNVGPGDWSLMSTGVYGGNGLQPESPAHMGGWASLFLGWSESIRPAQDTTLHLAPMTSGGPVVEFWFQGESNAEHFLLENRSLGGFDRSLRKPGMLITHVDEDQIAQRIPGNLVNAGPNPALVLVEADGDSDLFLGYDHGGNHGDRFDPFPGDSLRTNFDDGTRPSTRTFRGAVTNIALSGIARVGDEIQVDVRVRAPGWLPTEDHTDPLFQPLGSTSSGNLAVMDPEGSVDVVSSELRGGRPQVVLHRRTAAGWSDGIQLSFSPAAALTPAIASLPGGNAAVVWSDVRNGRSRIWSRVRLQGEWSPERVLADVPGENRSPVIGADGHGRTYVAWLNIQNGLPRVYFTRFVYFAPFGQPIPVTPITTPPRLPDNPAIAVDEAGISYIIWPDAADNPQRLWFTRFHPDSGLAMALPLTATAGAETGVSALVDPSGTIHLVWQVRAGMSEIHYQRRFKTQRPAPRDTAVVSSGVPVGSPRLAMDPSGSLHLVYESTVGDAQQICYKRWRPAWGWDFQGTQISSALDGSASAPLVLPESAGNVSVLYVAYGDAGARFMERRRELDVAPPPPATPRASAPPAALSLRPNPLRAGQEFELEWGGAPPAPGATAELFDLAGRRVSAATLERRGTGWRARFSPALTSRLSSGVYFVRAQAAGARARRLVVLR